MKPRDSCNHSQKVTGKGRREVGEDGVLEAKERMSRLPLNAKTINMWLKCLHLPAKTLPSLPETEQALGEIFKFFITIPPQND